MMKYLLLILIVICSLSCSDKVDEDKPLIEIYQLNKRITSYEGKPYHLSSAERRFDSIFYQKYKDIIRLTDSASYLINGGFEVSINDLENIPLISDNLIKGFNFNKNELHLNEKACEKLNHNNKYDDVYPDKQLVLTIDRKPIMTFYQMGMMSSWQIGDSYYILSCDDDFTAEIIPEEGPEFIGPKSQLKIKKVKNILHFFKGPLFTKLHENKPNLKKDSIFYNAFKRADKIIEE